MTHIKANSHEATAVLDSYFALASRGPEFRRVVALEAWDSLTPAEKLRLQRTAYKLAGNDLRLGAEHTQSILFLKYLDNQIAMGAVPTDDTSLLER